MIHWFMQSNYILFVMLNKSILYRCINLYKSCFRILIDKLKYNRQTNLKQLQNSENWQIQNNLKNLKKAENMLFSHHGTKIMLSTEGASPFHFNSMQSTFHTFTRTFTHTHTRTHTHIHTHTYTQMQTLQNSSPIVSYDT